MKRILEQTKYITLIAVFTLLVIAVIMLGWGVVKTGQLAVSLLTPTEKSLTVVPFIELLDIFLIAVSIYIFAVALYELFIGDLDLPAWLHITHFSGLKEKLAGLLVLIIGINFLKIYADTKDGVTVLLMGAGAAAVIFALVAFLRDGGGDHGDKPTNDPH
jgi:uncharacterized membrane protein YqhA